MNEKRSGMKSPKRKLRLLAVAAVLLVAVFLVVPVAAVDDTKLIKICIDEEVKHSTDTIQEAVKWVYDQEPADEATTYDINIPAGTYTENVAIYMAKNSEASYSNAPGQGPTTAKAAKRQHTYYALNGAINEDGSPATILEGSISVYSGSYPFRQHLPDCHAGVGISNITFVAQTDGATLVYFPVYEPGDSGRSYTGRYQSNQNIINCIFDGNGKSGVYAVSAPTSKQSLRDITIKDCKANDVEGFVSFGSSVNIEINGCELTNVENAIKGSNADTWKVENCNVNDYTSYGIRLGDCSEKGIPNQIFQISDVTLTGFDRSIVLQNNANDDITITNSDFSVLTSEHKDTQKSRVTLDCDGSFVLVALSGDEVYYMEEDQHIKTENLAETGYSEDDTTKVITATDGKIIFTTATLTSYLVAYPFTVEHYKETSPGVYVLQETDTETRYAGLSQTVTAEQKTYDGFTYDETIDGSVTTAAMQKSGVVLKNYYKNDAYKTIAAEVKPENSGSVTGVGTYSKNEEVTLTAKPAKGFAFVNWTENGAEVSKNAVLTITVTSDRNLVANFAPSVHTVIWADEDGTELEKDENVVYGTMPSYDGAEPTKPDTGIYQYTFNGWDKELVVVTSDVIYNATYKAVPVESQLIVNGDDVPQGSSVWLTETPTPTETVTPTPSETVPTDVPTTQPTPKPEKQCFGILALLVILAVLAGLGTVAVLRRK